MTVTAQSYVGAKKLQQLEFSLDTLTLQQNAFAFNFAINIVQETPVTQQLVYLEQKIPITVW